MAKPWIKMLTDLADSPEVLTMKRVLELPDAYSVVGRLHAFWSWWDEKSRNGRVDGAVTVTCDEVVHTAGFGAALVTVKWLVEDGEGLYMPHHERHNGRAAKERALGNQRQEAYRSRNGQGNAPVTQKSRSSNGNRVTRLDKSFINKHPTVTKSSAAPAAPRTSTPVENPQPQPPAAPRSEPPGPRGGVSPSEFFRTVTGAKPPRKPFEDDEPPMREGTAT